MKKMLFLVLALVVAGMAQSVETNEQVAADDSKSCSFGVRLGYNASGLRIDDTFADYLDLMSIEGKLTNGVNVGVFAERALTSKIDGHVELNFVQKGSAYDMYANEANHGTSGHGETNLNYVELGLMAKVKFGPAYIGFGPNFGYLASAQEINYKTNEAAIAGLIAQGLTEAQAEAGVLASLQAGGQNITSLRDDEFYDMDLDAMNRLDIGGQFGLGVQMPVGSYNVFGELKGGVSFTNWEESAAFEAAGFEYKRNLAFTFSLGVVL